MARRGKKAKDGDVVEADGADAKRALSLADHPRARGQIRTVRAWVALGAFAFVLVLALRAGRPLEGSLGAALEGGVAGYLLGWAIMVMAWRQLAQAEIESARRKIVAALIELEAAEREGGAA